MSDKLITIDLGATSSKIDITNMTWSNYSEIALETMIKLLKTGLDDEYHDTHRNSMIDIYQKLFDSLKKGYSTYRGQAINLDDTIIEKILSRIK